MRDVNVENLFVGGIKIDKFEGEVNLKGMIDLTWVPSEKLIKDFERHVRSEREEGHLVLCHIIEIENRKLYLDLGYTSMNRYLVRELKYSDDVAYAKIKAAQLLRQNPEIGQKVLDGDLKITQLQKVTNAIKAYEKTEFKKNSAKDRNPKEDGNFESADALKAQSRIKDQTFMKDLTKDILAKIENKTLFETEMVLAKELNIKPTVYQKITPQADDSVLAKIPFTKEQYEIIQKAQDLMSHVVTDKNLADAIEYLAKFYIKSVERKDTKTSVVKGSDLANGKESKSGKLSTESKLVDGKKCETKPKVKTEKETEKLNVWPKAIKGQETEVKLKEEPDKNITPSFRLKRENEGPDRKQNVQKNFNLKPGHSPKRKYISVKIRRAVFAKAQNCCEHVNSSSHRRCSSRYQLQIDHIVPASRGGSDTPENLRVLCGTHNRWEYKRWGYF